MTKKPSLLIVDADRALAATIGAAASAAGHVCETVPSGERALALLSAQKFDVMLADASSGTNAASELMRRVKRIAPDMLVVLSTADVEHFSYEEAMESGAADFITKPFAPRELLFRLEHVIRQEHLRRMSVTDDLTGLYNRRGFYTLAEQQMKMARRQKRGIYLLYADVDGLKAINDRWGHQQGDRALVDAAQLLQHTYRESDIIARIGGDEFIVVPIGSSGDNSPAIIARLFEHLADYNGRKNRGWKLQFSVGTSYYNPEDPCTVDQLLAAGDRSMYEDKKKKN